MKDFKALQATHEALLVRQNHLDQLVQEQKNIQNDLDGLTRQLKEMPPSPDRMPLEVKQADLTNKIKDNHTQADKLAEELLNAVIDYIQEVKSSSATIGIPRQREQLRANLRYWANVIYEKTGSYPNTDLAPASVTLAAPSRLGFIILIPVALIIVLVGAILIIAHPGTTPAITATKTVVTGQPAPSRTVIISTPRPTFTTLPSVPTASTAPSKTPTPTPTPTLNTLTPIPPTNIPAVGILAQLTYPTDGLVVSPSITFTGIYTNLQPKWTIHVLIQPKTKPGLSYYPLPNYFTVLDNALSGEWSLTGQFGNGAELEKPEQYNIKVVVATDATSSTTLNQTTGSGLESLPTGVLAFPKITNVSRLAYHLIDATRLVYTSIDQVEGGSSIVTSDLTGLDLRKLPHDASLAESFPALSPDGTRIAFVAFRHDSKNNSLYSIGIMDSNGDNPRFFFESPILMYQEPLWSPDGQHLVFSATDRTPFASGGSTWNIYLANTQAMIASDQPTSPRVLTTNELAGVGKVTNRYPDWLDNQTIIYTLLSQDKQSIYSCNVNTLDIRPFYADPLGGILQATLSPDKKAITYLLSSFGGLQIFVARLNADLSVGKPFAISSVSQGKNYPRWDPTGQTIFYEFDGVPNSTLWAINADGSGLRQITRGAKTSDQQPFVGHMVAYFLLPGQSAF